MQTTKRGIADMYQAIDELDFSRIKAKLLHRQDGVIALRKIERAEAGYRRFLKLAAKYPDAPIVPTEEVDEFWHMHILDTQRYSADCERIFGYVIHHDPYTGIEGGEDEARHLAQAEASRDLTAREFGEGECNATAYCVRPEAKGDGAAYCVRPEVKGDAAAYCVRPMAKGDAAAYCVRPEAKGDAAAYCVRPEAKGDAAAYCVRPMAKGDAAAYCVRPEAKGDAAAYCVRPAAKGDAVAYCVRPAANAAQAAYCVKPVAKADATAYCVRPAASAVAYCVRPVAAPALQRCA